MKRFLSLVMLFLTVAVLVGCGGGPDKKTKSTYEVKSLAELRAASSIQITFRHPFGAGIQEVLKDLKESFESEFPNIEVELEYIGGYDPMKEATIYDINGGIAPTLSVGYPDHFAEYLVTDSIISLDGFIFAEDPEIALDDINDFLPGYLKENQQFDKEGSFKGLPFNKSTEALYYNKEFFDHFELKVPETWAEYEEVSAQIMEIVKDIKDDEFPFLGKIKTNLANEEFMPGMYDSTGNLFTTIIHQFDGLYTRPYYREGGLTDVQRGELSFVNNAKAKEALTYMQSLANKNYLNVPEYWEGTFGSNFFINGQILMNIGSTAGSSYYSASIAEWAVAPIPYSDANHKYVIQQGTNIAIFSQATDLEKLAAWMFIKHCLTPENTADFAIRTGYMPVRKSAYELDFYQEFLTNPTGGEISTSKIHNATAQYSTGGWNYFVDAAWSGSNKVRNEAGTAIVDIMVSKMDVQQAFNAAKARYGG